MFMNDIIDRKIEALLDYIGESIDENDENDLFFYGQIRDFAERSGGLLYLVGNDPYLVINFIGEDDMLIIPGL